ncbi:winged helix-turn-helix domain-containing protein [Gymnodinialimonas ceratoperidinii]|uniref:Winged helix DNA-binding domain-containing protein n=1 Tax=Gymnodinialimonas ceratoperidinii TaxID=2856823 RepID=A0A8F6YBM4_9RHOB|nr:crosslink repair DNA glycosylase YcaQ family protein [Gymnodinialimonas ceratoperidinii]QXT41109.1 winged helix DNA-binding domain-containing protein [Gymnodinialimonas ceratoperidinii]
MTVPVLTNDQARRLFLARHGLMDPPSGKATGAALAGLIDSLGFVQVDSVNTFARAHDLILWSRRQSYRPESLRWINDRARATFEHWTHDASIIPMAFYPLWRMRFERDRERLHGKWKDWHGAGFHPEIDRVLNQVAEQGPCCSADMEDDRPEKSTGWWDWKPSKVALEYLWRSGDLAVTKRVGFRKFYDLSERVIPADTRAVQLSDDEIIEQACVAAMDRLGFATSGELAAFFALIRPEHAKQWVAGALAERRLTEVDITGADGQRKRAFMWVKDLETLAELPAPSSRVRVLSPFDPALRERKRAERLFGFHYRIEIFVPAPRRRYGYYVFPVLEGTRLIGRIDMARDNGVLHVRAFWPETGVRMGSGRVERLRAELERAARFATGGALDFAEDWLRGPLS